MPANKTINILVVDDYSTARRIARSLLKQLGFENIDEASDGSEALTKLRGKIYGLIMSDWGMEPMTALELLKQVRADEKLKTIPFIMVASESKPENVMAAKNAGVSNYIIKPFNAETLKTKMKTALGEF